MLNRSHHQVTHVLTPDAARGGEEAHGLAITAVQCEGDPHLLTVVAANLEAIGAPTAVAFIYCNPTVVPPLNAANVAIEQEAVDLHHAVDPFVIGRLATSGQSPSLEDGVDPPITVGRQPGDDRLDVSHQLVVR